MLRIGLAALAGGLFGLGLLVSGMTDTDKVRGWLDILGDWDPTLAFVMGGAILPMAVAWRIAARRGRSALGVPIGGRSPDALDGRLLGGSALFGAGWALAGFCPGPALASLWFGGWQGLLFLCAMLAGMVAAPLLRPRHDGPVPE